MKHPIVFIVLSTVLGTVFSCLVHGQAPSVVHPNDAPDSMMSAKLQHSQNVLAALIRKDFSRIRKNARAMQAISEAAEWPRARDSVYEHFGREFRRQCAQLDSLAEKQNHEGVTFVYLQMTTTCVQCHNHVRDSLRVAQLKNREGVAPIPSRWPATGEAESTR